MKEGNEIEQADLFQTNRSACLKIAHEPDILQLIPKFIYSAQKL